VMASEMKMFIGGLPAETQEMDLRSLFSMYGDVSDCHLMAPSGKSGQRCAFVKYQTKTAESMCASAIAALHGQHKMKVEDDAIVVRIANNDGSQGGKGGAGALPPAPAAAPALGFGDTNAAFAAAFPDVFGMGGVGGMGGMGMDNIYAQALQAQAMQAANPFAPAMPAAMPGMSSLPGMPGAAPAGAEPKLFVGNLPGHTADPDVRMLFQAYGAVTDVHLMKPSAKTGQRCAFVCYGSAQECQAAIDGLANYRVTPSDERPILVRFANSTSGPPTPKPAAFAPPPQAAAGVVNSAVPPGAEPKLFIGNLPGSTSEADLRMIFNTYGAVEDVHLMVPSAQTGQRCAFIRYPTTEECQKAIEGLANYMVEGSPILVRFANSPGQKRARIV